MDKISVFRPSLPQASFLLKYLEEIDTNRWYTNFGPLTVEFEKKLANYFEVLPENLTTVSNGTDALSLALMAMAPIYAKKYCLMPSWTFVATPSAALMAGLEPVFCDVDLKTWALTPRNVFDAIRELNLREEEIHSVIAVSPFGAPISLNDWEDFQEMTGIKVLIDAAASFDSLKKFEGYHKSTLPVMVSLHATKVFGIGEGALVLNRDNSKLIAEIRQRANFGFWGAREAQVIGTNAKLSEYASAVGLAELEGWSVKSASWNRVTNFYLDYRDEFKIAGISFLEAYGGGWFSSYCNIIFKSQEMKKNILEKLNNKKIDYREWWGHGADTQKAFTKFKRADLSKTKGISSVSVGLPFYTDLSKEQVDYIAEAILGLK